VDVFVFRNLTAIRKEMLHSSRAAGCPQLMLFFQ
jgi:hypothetical protein